MIEHLAYVPHAAFLLALARGWWPDLVSGVPHHDAYSTICVWRGVGEPDLFWRRG